MKKALHIVSFDVPFPPSYGGVIDVFYKIRALHEAGVRIHLHCFEYGRGKSPELEKYCEQVFYYPRSKSPMQLFSSLPFVAATRQSEALTKNLLSNDWPILFEGLHCCAILSDSRLASRTCIVRMHNIEHEYYEALARVEERFFRRWYFKREAAKLKRFEPVLKKAAHTLAISPADTRTLSALYPNVHHVMAFHPHEQVNIRPGKGKFALYHGNLEVGENNQAAIYLAEKIFNDLDVPLIIAGNNPSPALLKAAEGKKNIRIEANISTQAIDELISEAQINILPTFQATGIKLKLLAALFRGRHCLVNTPMVKDTGVESLCVIADDQNMMRQKVKELFDLPFDQNAVAAREKILLRDFSNRSNAAKILDLL